MMSKIRRFGSRASFRTELQLSRKRCFKKLFYFLVRIFYELDSKIIKTEYFMGKGKTCSIEFLLVNYCYCQVVVKCDYLIF